MAHNPPRPCDGTRDASHHRRTGRSVLGTPPEACKVLAHHPGVNADMGAPALRRLHQAPAQGIRPGVLDADANLVADDGRVREDVDELVPARAAGDGGAPRGRSGFLRPAVVLVLVRARGGDGVHQDVDVTTQPRTVAFQPDLL